MPDVTGTLGWRIPVLSDDPNVPRDITNLADDAEASVALVVALPSGSTGNSTYLTATGGGDPANPDKRLTQSATTDILTSTFTLTRDQAVLVGAKVLLVNTGSATGALGVCISIDGTMVAGYGQAGSVELGATGTSTDQINTAIPTFAVNLAAGSHTVVLQADRDGNGVINARATTTPNGRTYHPTSLTIIV